jgi:hypothetical protein
MRVATRQSFFDPEDQHDGQTNENQNCVDHDLSGVDAHP